MITKNLNTGANTPGEQNSSQAVLTPSSGVRRITNSRKERTESRPRIQWSERMKIILLLKILVSNSNKQEKEKKKERVTIR